MLWETITDQTQIMSGAVYVEEQLQNLCWLPILVYKQIRKSILTDIVNAIRCAKDRVERTLRIYTRHNRYCI